MLEKGALRNVPPFWLTPEEDRDFAQQLFFYELQDHQLKPLWMSSNPGIPIQSIVPDETPGRFQLISPDGSTSRWNWGLFGPERLPEETSGKTEIELLFTGDLLFQEDLLARDAGELLSDCQSLFQEADLVGGNLEGPLTAGPPSGRFPLFRYPTRLAAQLKAAGFDFLQCANNHSLDGGPDGLRDTLQALNEAGLSVLGLRARSDEAGFLMVERQGIRIGLCAFTYENPPLGSQAFPSLNGHPLPPIWQKRLDSFPYLGVDKTSWNAGLECLKQRADEMKKAGADYVIFCLHWGKEYSLQPEAQQEELAQVLADAGVDLILGTHAHLPQPLRSLSSSDGSRRCLCYYSLGNLLSLQRPGPLCASPLLEGGAIARIRLSLDQGRLIRVRADYLPIAMARDPYRVLLLDGQPVSASLAETADTSQPLGEQLDSLRQAIAEQMGPPLCFDFP